MDVLLFEVADTLAALPSAGVEEVMLATAVAPLPGAPDFVKGVLVLRGQATPVAGVRERVGLPGKPITASDHFIVARMGGRRVALQVDRAIGLKTIDDTKLSAMAAGLASSRIAGAFPLNDGLVFVHDLDAFLSNQESAELAAALEAAP